MGLATFLSSQYPDNLKQFDVYKRLVNTQILFEAIRRTDPEGNHYFQNMKNDMFKDYLKKGFDNDPVDFLSTVEISEPHIKEYCTFVTDFILIKNYT